MRRIHLTLLLLVTFCIFTAAANAQWVPRKNCASNPLSKVFRTDFVATPTLAMLTSPIGRCDDYGSVCADSEENLYRACWFLGESDCNCKGMRQFNKCMEEVGCPGYSEALMLEMGCQSQPIIP